MSKSRHHNAKWAPPAPSGGYPPPANRPPRHGFTTVNDPNGVGATTINDVNDRGDLVGFYVDSLGNTDGMLATPQR